MKIFFDTNVYIAAALLGESGYNSRGRIPEATVMSTTVAGFVKNGVVVPNTPLPEGAFVEVHVVRGPIEVPPELQEEFDAWERAGAGTIEMIERLADEAKAHEKR